MGRRNTQLEAVLHRKKKLKALAEIDERETQIEEMDIQAAVGFGEFVLLNASRL